MFSILLPACFLLTPVRSSEHFLINSCILSHFVSIADDVGAPWCSADPIYTNHPVNCEGLGEGQLGCMVMDKDTGMWSQAKPVGCGSLDYRYAVVAVSKQNLFCIILQKNCFWLLFGSINLKSVFSLPHMIKNSTEQRSR